MSVLQLIFQKKRGFVDPNQTGAAAKEQTLVLVLDALIRETPKYSAEMTKSPIEGGSAINDHVVLNPETLTIEGIITNTPAKIGGPLNVKKNAQDAFDYLLALRETREPFDFVGGFKLYRNMVLTDFTPHRDKRTANTLTFTATMQKAIIVDSQTVLVANLANPANAGKVDRGSQPTEKANDKTAKKASLLFKGFKGTADFFSRIPGLGGLFGS